MVCQQLFWVYGTTPAPMDTSNAVYDAAEFLNGAMSAYQSAPMLAANSYDSSSGCSYESQRCTGYSWFWLQNFVGGNKKVILTEYSLAPPTETIQTLL